ncbi:MAG: hypothetical protein Ct9H300mP7_6930 [Verrucomicrobiota bacterium]|nr:MAG: hypothetical protein Ct9H300mP7_6930 [Verrucomicrobiota bacterium]
MRIPRGSVLPSGNILYSARNVAKEMTRDMKVLEIRPGQPKRNWHRWRLANGNTWCRGGPKPRLREITKEVKLP